MYLVREAKNGFFVDYKLKGHLVESFFVTITPKKECSCKYFAESHNHYNHFHINLVERWIKDGKPRTAMYEKTKDGKINVLFEGIK